MRPISFATPTTTTEAAPRADKGSPSFLIPGVSSKAAPTLRLDRINSSQVIQAARRVWSQSLEEGACRLDPSGVVLSRLHGRLVFDLPVLLPEEQFVPIELIRGSQRNGGPGRLRLPRKPSSV